MRLNCHISMTSLHPAAMKHPCLCGHKLWDRDAAIPIPILCLILISVIIRRPSWFMDMVQDIYREEGA